MKRSNDIMIVLMLMIGLLTIISCAKKDRDPANRKNETPVFKNNDTWKSSALLDTANALLDSNQFHRSWNEYEMYTSQFLEQGDTLNYIYCQIQKAKILILQNRLDEAYNLLIKKKNLTEQSYNDHLISEFYYNVGTIFTYQNNIDSSLYYLQKAVAIQKSTYSTPNEDIIRSYIGLGNIYRYLIFDYEKASNEFEKALSLIDSLNSPNLNETHFRCLYNLATTYRIQNDFDKALYYGMECLKYSKLLADTVILKYSNSMMANIHSSRKEYDKAIDFYKRNIHIEENSNEMDMSFYVFCVNNLGITYLIKGDHDSAIYNLKKILKLDLSSVNSSDHLVSEILYNLGQSYNGKHKYDSAIYFLNKSLIIFNKIYHDKHSEISEVYHELGNSYKNLGKIDTSLYYYQNALIHLSENFNESNILRNPGLSDIDLNNYAFSFIGKKAQALLSAYLNNQDTTYLKASLSTFLLADSALSEHRNKYLLENDELWLAKEAKEYIDAAINCTYELFNRTKNQKYLNILFGFIEKNNARILLKTLSNLDNLNISGVPDSIINKRMYLNMQFLQMQDKLKKEEHEKEKDAIRSHLYTIIRDQEKLEKHLELTYPKYYRARNIKDTLQLHHLQHFSKKYQTAIVQYKYLENSLFIINTLPDTSIIIKINSIQKLSGDIGLLRSVLLNSNPFDLNQYEDFINSSYSIYRQIMMPVIDHINSNNNKISSISIIPDGDLSLIPFECLISEIPEITRTPNYKALKYLVRTYPIHYNYSANFLFHEKYYRIRSLPYSIIGFAYNELNTENHPNLKKLTGTLKEMSVIKKYSDTRVFNEEEATETNFKTFADKAHILHIGIHGIASNQEEKYNSELLFNRNESDTINDGNLYIYELYNMKLNARLSVLSACESGVGSLETGEGVYSMARGFFYAGCPSVIMSLWKINDQSNTLLMASFYNEIEKGKSINNALRNAKLNYLDHADEITSHPSNWAPMVLLGNNSTLKIQKTSPNYIRYILLIAAVIIIIITTRYVVRKKIKIR